MENSVAAQQAGDYVSAHRHAESAFMLISVLPDSEFENERLQWDRERIESLVKYLQGRASAQPSAGGPRGSLIRPNPILYTRG